MLNIDSLQNGIVIDHIKAGTSMMIYDLLDLGELGIKHLIDLQNEVTAFRD